MTLRRHHYLAILPLFALLGVANALLSAWLDHTEVSAGLREEATTLAAIEAAWPADLPPPPGFVALAPADADARLAALRQTIWQRGVLFTLAALLAGILVAELLTRLSLRELRLLQHTADRLADGLPDAPAPDGRIREFADLGSTLGTLSQILQENIRHTRTRLLRHDRTR